MVFTLQDKKAPTWHKIWLVNVKIHTKSDVHFSFEVHPSPVGGGEGRRYQPCFDILTRAQLRFMTIVGPICCHDTYTYVKSIMCLCFQGEVFFLLANNFKTMRKCWHFLIYLFGQKCTYMTIGRWTSRCIPSQKFIYVKGKYRFRHLGRGKIQGLFQSFSRTFLTFSRAFMMKIVKPFSSSVGIDVHGKLYNAIFSW